MSINPANLFFLAFLAGCPREIPPVPSAPMEAPVSPDGSATEPTPSVDDGGSPNEDTATTEAAQDAPAPEERCFDGVDNDGDGLVDESGDGAVPTWVDGDGDGWGDEAWPTVACPGAPFTSNLLGDCDDTRPEVHPGAAEVWYDGIDQDCEPATEWDRDLDGIQASGTPGAGEGDCDDGDAAVGGPTTWYQDSDADGFGSDASIRLCHAPVDGVAVSGDCDDLHALTYPGAVDQPYDGRDADCAGDDDYDIDGDGFAHPSAGRLPADCDDEDETIWPGAVEQYYDGVDQDCDPSNEFDADLDGVDVVGPDGDCDDLDAAVGSPNTFFADLDRDGFGDPGAAIAACSAPPGYLTDASDCDDRDATDHPGAAERCDGDDDDCDGAVDEDGGPLWMTDVDGDDWGVLDGFEFEDCRPQPGMTTRGGDCDDALPHRHPGAWEVCDGVDNDCDDATEADPVATCPARSERFDYLGHRYLALHGVGRLRYLEAADACADSGYGLFVPDTDEESRVIRQQLDGWNHRVWTGIADCGSYYGIYDGRDGSCTRLSPTFLAQQGFAHDLRDVLGLSPDAAVYIEVRQYTWLEDSLDENSAYEVICETE